MTRKTLRRVLFVALLLTLPVPFYLGDLETSPPVRLLFLSGIAAAVAITEGGGATLSLLAVLGAVQSALALAAAWALAALGARAIHALPAEALRRVALVIVVLALLAFSLQDVYHTSLSSTQPRSNLLHLFE